MEESLAKFQLLNVLKEINPVPPSSNYWNFQMLTRGVSYPKAKMHPTPSRIQRQAVGWLPCLVLVFSVPCQN
jgi:hypothetical protein